MSDKKHIDRVFQEKFKDFEVSPNPKVWKGIQDKLNQPEKERRRIIPFWFKLGGVAALLLLFLTVGGLLVKNSDSFNYPNTKVVETENPSGETINSSRETANPSNETNNNSGIVNSLTDQNNQENLEDSNLESETIKNSLTNSNASKGSQIASEENETKTKSGGNNNNNNNNNNK